MPSIGSPTPTRRATLAGFCTAGSLTAAVTIVAAVIAGVVAHTVWPESPQDVARPAVGIAADGGRITVSRAAPPGGLEPSPSAIATPVAARGPAVSRPATVVALPRPVIAGQEDEAGRHAPADAAAPNVGTALRPQERPPTGLTPLVAATVSGSDQVAEGVREGGDTLGEIVARINPKLGAAVSAIGAEIGSDVTHAGAIVEALVHG